MKYSQYELQQIDNEIQKILYETEERIKDLLKPFEIDFQEDLPSIWLDDYQHEFYSENEDIEELRAIKKLEHKKHCDKWLSFWKDEQNLDNNSEERKLEIEEKILYWSVESE